MSIELFIAEQDEQGMVHLPDGQIVHMIDTPVGAIWPCDCHDRRGWVIHLPDDPGGGRHAHNLFCTLLGTKAGNGWTVTGEAPKLTVNPSIFCSPPTGWHGWVRDGEIVQA